VVIVHHPTPRGRSRGPGIVGLLRLAVTLVAIVVVGVLLAVGYLLRLTSRWSSLWTSRRVPRARVVTGVARRPG